MQFIDSDWTLQSFCLDTVPIFEDHTGQNIAHAFPEVFQNWNLDPRKLVVTTTDSGRNYVAAFTTLERERVSSFGHNQISIQQYLRQSK